MARHMFRDVNMRHATVLLIGQCNTIIQEYQDDGLTMTLRQLYYQLVSRDIVPNSEKSYDRVGTLLNNGRLAGLVDWDAIEDRGRQVATWVEYDNAADFMRREGPTFRLRRTSDQPNYIELWVEKDALSNVLRPLAARYHVPLMVNRGYSSQSAMYRSSLRFIDHCDKVERHILYLGDLDPSGEDMVRDIRDRMEMFGADVEVTKVALNMDQVQQYNPPPNPAKMTDSRAAAYVAQHGHSSWEVDALSPPVLRDLITNAITQRMNMKLYNAWLAREGTIRTKLQEVADTL